jgi:hypothetical protein
VIAASHNRHRETPFVCLAAHETRVSAVDDCLNVNCYCHPGSAGGPPLEVRLATIWRVFPGFARAGSADPLRTLAKNAAELQAPSALAQHWRGLPSCGTSTAVDMHSAADGQALFFIALTLPATWQRLMAQPNRSAKPRCSAEKP